MRILAVCLTGCILDFVLGRSVLAVSSGPSDRRFDRKM